MPKRAREASLKSKSERTPGNPTVPAVLQRLEGVFKAVNTFCTFCDARLTTTLTFSMLTRSIPNLEIRDLAAFNVLLPDFVKFSHEENELIIQFGNAVSRRAALSKHIVPNRLMNDEASTDAQRIYKPETVKKTIESNNRRFQQAIMRFLRLCTDQQSDPEQQLEQSILSCMPSLPETSPHVPSPQDAPDAETTRGIANVIDELYRQPFYTDQIQDTHRRSFPEKSSQYGVLDPPLSEQIQSTLAEKGISQLYSHQAEAIQSLRQGHHVVVSTATASGKSLIYQIPVLEQLLQDRSSRAMYIFPTKALAQDQMRALQELLRLIPDLEDVMISTFDGDTPTNERRKIKNQTSIVFTNPDALHHAILPFSENWRWFLTNLKLVVVDELHVYNGLFGTHVSLILRRFRRLCHHYGNDRVQFVSCSATIGQPDKHMKLVFGVQDVKHVSSDGAPSGKKEFVLWRSPLVQPNDPRSPRRSAISEGADLLEYLVTQNIRVIAFCKIRKTCELLLKQLQENFTNHDRHDLLDKVMSYRGGYMPQDRRHIERRMFSGSLLAIIATNALELGIDIGSLDAVVMIGIPWSMSSLWQQSGRAGRRNADSLALIVADHNPLDQFYINHPSELLCLKTDDIRFDVEHSLALEGHLQCAAEELPLDPEEDQQFFGPRIREICEEHLVPIHDGKLYRPHPRFRPYPSQFIHIRNIGENSYYIVDVTNGRNVILEEIEQERAPFEIYEGAIFLHQGRSFLVEECNVDQRYAKVHLVNVDWTTQQRDFTNVNAIQTTVQKPVGQTRYEVSFGKVQVETVVFGYFRVDKKQRIIGNEDIYMDPIVRFSTGLWADIPREGIRKIETLAIDIMASIHGACHALISLLPRYSNAATTDIKTECKSPHATRPRPMRIILYESSPSGIARQAFQHFTRLAESAAERIAKCSCESGCTSCVQLTTCSEHNVLVSKTGALIVLRSLLGLKVDSIRIQDIEHPPQDTPNIENNIH